MTRLRVSKHVGVCSEIRTSNLELNTKEFQKNLLFAKKCSLVCRHSKLKHFNKLKIVLIYFVTL